MWQTVGHLFHPQRSNNHRPRALHPQAYVVYAACLVLFACVLEWATFARQGSVLGFASNITPTQIIEQTNAERKTLGLPAVTLNAQLSEAASKKAADMLAQQYWSHVSPAGKEPWSFMQEVGYVYQAAGENLARDFGTTQPMIQAWMASPTHRANIVNPRYSEMGIAVVDGTLNGYETTLVVQMFGQPRGAVAQVIPDEGAMAVEAAPPAQSTVPLAPTPVVLARVLVPGGSIERAPLFSPLQLSKAFFLAVIMMIVLTLVYDTAIIGHRRTMRLVGHNLGHIVFLLTASFLVILFKGGIIK